MSPPTLGKSKNLRLVAFVVNGLVDCFILANLAAFFKSRRRMAWLKCWRLPRWSRSLRSHTNSLSSTARRRSLRSIVEVGNLPDDLVVIALKKRRGSVFALHLESLGRLAFTEEGRDLAIAAIFSYAWSHYFAMRISAERGWKSAIVSPASIDWHPSLVVSILIVMPVFATPHAEAVGAAGENRHDYQNAGRSRANASRSRPATRSRSCAAFCRNSHCRKS